MVNSVTGFLDFYFTYSFFLLSFVVGGASREKKKALITKQYSAKVRARQTRRDMW